MPIARPRRSAGNQPTTRRPLAELLLAAAIPPRNSKTAVNTSESGPLPALAAAASAATAVRAEPTHSTKRSPARSTTYPQGISVGTMPNFGIAEISPAWARSRPKSVCRAGIRNATPLMKTLENRVAKRPMASIDQRRTAPMPWFTVP